MKQKRIEDYGINIGKLKKGKLNKISDVLGVKVGHFTINNDINKTGVTVIMPSEGNCFANKPVAAGFVLNGFGKSTGLIQINELGTIESPIALTNTLNVGLVYDALTEYMIQTCEKDGVSLRSVNPVVCECNDSSINNICKRAINKDEVFAAIQNASSDFEEGDIGAGKGMICHGLKGGIGSASRIVILDGKEYVFGVLVLSNHGSLSDLTINGERMGIDIKENIASEPDKGSVIVIGATDAPLSDRQLLRVIKRFSVGLARLGSYIGHGSGEVFIAFSTANMVNYNEKSDILMHNIVNERIMDNFFRAAAESCEEAVLNSMVCSGDVKALNEKLIKSLKNYLK